MNITPDRTVGSIVAEDYRAAAALTRHGIDYCCHGGLTFKEASERKQVDTGKLLEEIKADLARSNEGPQDERNWELDKLADHVETVHHRYVEERGPILKQHLQKICDVHGDQHPELFEVQKEYNECFGGMVMHMKKEELMLFPYVRKLVTAEKSGDPAKLRPTPLDGSIAKLLDDHTDEGERFERIRKMTGNYTVPEDGCETYAATFSMLKEFEGDLHRHIHLENNILFPRAIELEKNLASHVAG